MQTDHTDSRGDGYYQATDVQFVGLVCSMYQEPMSVSHRQRWNYILHDCSRGRVPPIRPQAYLSQGWTQHSQGFCSLGSRNGHGAIMNARQPQQSS